MSWPRPGEPQTGSVKRQREQLARLDSAEAELRIRHGARPAQEPVKLRGQEQCLGEPHMFRGVRTCARLSPHCWPCAHTLCSTDLPRTHSNAHSAAPLALRISMSRPRQALPPALPFNPAGFMPTMKDRSASPVMLSHSHPSGSRLGPASSSAAAKRTTFTS